MIKIILFITTTLFINAVYTFINNITIPGTHDSGTYDIGQLTNFNIFNKIFRNIETSVLSGAGQTQDLDITEQLNSGIRYFDIRIANNKNNPTYLFLKDS